MEGLAMASARRRRQVVLESLLVPVALALGSHEAAAESLTATPACEDGDEPTPPETEGPFFKPRSPERTSLLEPGAAGTRIVLTGLVLSTACRPVAGALLDFWHADAAGAYDNQGYRFRGHQYADGAGRYRLLTIVPGLYPGRTRHFHVKVQAPHRPVLTTQLYFPNQARNRSDSLFRSDLVVRVGNAAGGRTARFDFVLDLG
jgi:protocatechuate 3,4-dioxygenase beta subunit